MNSEKYVLEHDFGYCREPELEELFKLELRNFEDLKVYVNDIITKSFVATVKNNIVHFKQDDTKILVTVEKC